MKTYLYKGTEVVLTGRRAEKQLRIKQDVLYEIRPLSIDDGSNKSWVRLNELYDITKDNTDADS